MKRQHGTQETLLAWASALTAVAKLQAVLEVASEDMTARDDWSWQQHPRALVKRTFTLLENQQEPRLLFETAQELQQEAEAGIEVAQRHLVI